MLLLLLLLLAVVILDLEYVAAPELLVLKLSL